MDDDDMDALVVVTDAFLQQGKELREYLHSPSGTAWMMLYRYGSKLKFLNATSLTRSASHQLLHRAEEALAKVLNGYAPARIYWPSPARKVELAKLVQSREPLLTHTFGFIDGKNLKVQQPSNADLQNSMYNGWLHTVLVTVKDPCTSTTNPLCEELLECLRRRGEQRSGFKCS
ncbi:hypothetical protein PC120_g12337 [Phytophthora cactorum]|nr:hypothetical protein PC120_g12337 [Phytophthora cactorum]